MGSLALIGVSDLDTLIGGRVGLATSASEGWLDGLGDEVCHYGGFFFSSVSSVSLGRIGVE